MATMPQPCWSMTYSASRRKHNHRCWHCHKIIADGEAVLMARVGGGKTKCAHEACADVRVGSDLFTVREYLEAAGIEHLKAVGFRAARDWCATAPICRPST